MSELNPTRVFIKPLIKPDNVSTRSLNLSGTPMPEDIRSTIVEHFKLNDVPEEELDVVYQYILSKSDGADIKDIKSTILSLKERFTPSNAETFRSIRDLAIKELALSTPHEKLQQKISIIDKELPILERQAKNSGDWRYYLRASQRKNKITEQLNEVGDN